MTATVSSAKQLLLLAGLCASQACTGVLSGELGDPPVASDGAAPPPEERVDAGASEDDELVDGGGGDPDLAPPSEDAAPPTHPADFEELLTTFDELVARYPDEGYNERPDIVGTSEGGYHMAQGLMALALVYEMTGEERYLQLATEMAMGFVTAGQHLDDDPYRDWYFGHPNPDLNGWWNHDHYEWRSWFGVSFAMHALASASTRTPSREDALVAMTASMEVDFYEKWQVENYPAASRSPTGSWGGKTSVSNFSTSGIFFQARIMMAMMNLHSVTGEARYLEALEAEGAALVEALERGYDPSVDAFNFAARKDFDGTMDSAGWTTMDISHGQDLINFFCETHRRGFTFGGGLDRELMDRLTNIVTNVIWTGDDFTHNVDGTGGVGTYASRQVAGWACLAAYDEALRQKFMDYVRAGRGEDINLENQFLLIANLMMAAR